MSDLNPNRGKDGKYNKKGLVERFYSMVSKSEGCWVWTGYRDKDGYGTITIDKVPVRSHRFSFELHKEQIPKGIMVLHSCDNPSCVNPEHLWLGTAKDNTKDMIKKGRKILGSRERVCRLTKEMVIEIRNSNDTQSALAARYGVDQSTIHHVISRNTWRHV